MTQTDTDLDNPVWKMIYSGFWTSMLVYPRGSNGTRWPIGQPAKKRLQVPPTKSMRKKHEKELIIAKMTLTQAILT